MEVLGVSREGETVSSHGVPAADCQQATLVVLPHQVLQHGPVVEEGVQVTAGHQTLASGGATKLWNLDGQDLR